MLQFGNARAARKSQRPMAPPSLFELWRTRQTPKKLRLKFQFQKNLAHFGLDKPMIGEIVIPSRARNLRNLNRQEQQIPRAACVERTDERLAR
jgi:hypothetical protein